MLKQQRENENIDPKTQARANSPSSKSHRLSPKPHHSDSLLLAVEDGIANGQCDLIHLLLTDPLLKELNVSLEKEAEQQKKNKLLQNFPLRYKNLVHTQMLYKKVQAQLKDYQKQSQEVIEQLQKGKQTLEDQLVFLKAELSDRDEQLIQIKQQHSSAIASLCEENRARIEQIERIREEQLAEQDRKMTKIRSEKDHIMQFLEEMKEQSDNLKFQNSRIVQILTQKDLEISQLHSTIAESQAQYHNTKQSFMAQLIQLELDSSQQVQQTTKAYDQLSLVAEGLKTRLRQSEDQIIEMLRQKEDEETDRFNQMQEIRSKLLETVREKNNLEEQIQLLRASHQKKVNELEDELRRSQREGETREKEMEALKIRQQSSLRELRQKVIRLEASKQSGIRQLQSKILQQNEYRIRLEEQLASLSKSREQLMTETVALKQQLQRLKTTTSESTSARKRAQSKNSEIQAMVGHLKKQLLNFNQIIQEKDLKIQQYRQQIYTFRSKINQLAGHLEQRGLEIAALQRNIAIQINQIDQLKSLVQQAQQKELEVNSQLGKYQKLLQGPKKDRQSQTQTQQQEQHQLQKVLEKTKLKYENAVEELRAYKVDFESRCKQHQQLLQDLSRTSREQCQTIEQLSHKLKQKQQALGKCKSEIGDLKESINQNMYDASQIQQVFDAKINQLKTFYQDKIAAESTKYKGVISLLKQEMSQLYQDIDLKKSIEAQIFKDIVNLDPHPQKTQP